MLDGLRRIVLSPPVKIVAAVVAAWLLFAWFAVGPILKWAAPRFVADNGGRVLALDRVHFNPFRLSLEIDGARLTEADGTPLLAFQRFLADFQLSSLFRRAWTFREIVLDAPSTLVALRADGTINWLEFIQDFGGDGPEPDPEPDAGPPRLLVERLAVTNGMADFSDRKFADDFTTRISPIDFEVHELSTLPDETGNHQLQLRTEIGARLQWQGTLGLNPLVASGEVALSDLMFERVWPYLEPRLAMAPPKGTAQLGFAYRLGYEGGGLSVVLEDIAATIEGLALAGTEAAEPGIRLDRIALEGGRFDLREQGATIESIEIAGGRIAARRGADGEVDIASWFASPVEAREAATAPAAPERAAAPADVAPPGDGAVADSGSAGPPAGDPPASPASAPAGSRARGAPGNEVSGTITPAPAGTTDEWRFEVKRIGLDGVALHYVDEGFARPLTAEAENLRLGLAVKGATGTDGAKLAIEGLGVELDGVSLAAEGIEDPVLRLAGARLEGGAFDLAERRLAADAIRFGEPRIVATRAGDGTIAVADAFAPAGGAKPGEAKAGDRKDNTGDPATKEGAGTEAAWRYRIGEVAIDGGEVLFRDASVEPGAEIGLQDIHVAVRDISDDTRAKWPAEARLVARGGGELSAQGEVIAAGPAVDLKLHLAGLGLAVAQPYLAQVARLRIVDGALSSSGRLRFGTEGLRYEGGMELARLDLHELETKETLLGWKSLATKKLEVRDDGVRIGEMLLDGLRARLIILEDRSVNVAKVVGPEDEAQQERMKDAAEEKGVDPSEPARGEPGFKVAIERLRLSNGDVDFADLSLALPFGTRIHELKGELASLSNDPGSAATIALEGKVDEFGTAKAAGEINLFAPAERTDARVQFRNVEMTKLTPYSATFAGRHIASGKLSLDLEYRIEDKQLQGDNRIVMEQLTLGEKVESEDAPNLPLDLAVAILKDGNGTIDLGLPVSGSLEDPTFSLGGLVGKALLGLVNRIVTAPFRALGALFGGGEDVDMSQVAFDAGSAELPGKEREKLAKLAEGLAKRPGLALKIEPGVHPELDGRALRGLELRREIAGRLGRRVDPEEDPGPVAMSDAATRSVLEAMFIEAFNAHELRQLRESPPPRQAPADGGQGTPAGGAAAPAPVEKPSDDGDPYRRMFERLRDARPLDEAALASLGKRRGEAIRAELEGRGVGAERLSITEPTEREARDGSVLVGLGLDARAAAQAARAGEERGRAGASQDEGGTTGVGKDVPGQAAGAQGGRDDAARGKGEGRDAAPARGDGAAAGGAAGKDPGQAPGDAPRKDPGEAPGDAPRERTGGSQPPAPRPGGAPALGAPPTLTTPD